MKLPDAIIIASSMLEHASCLITNDGGFDKAKNLIPVYTSEEFFKDYTQQADNHKYLSVISDRKQISIRYSWLFLKKSPIISNKVMRKYL